MFCRVRIERVISLIAFTVGGILIGRTIWGLLIDSFPYLAIILLGVVLFIIGGLFLHSFDEEIK